MEVTEEEEVTGDAEPEKDAEESTGEEESESPRKLTVSFPLFVYQRSILDK